MTKDRWLDSMRHELGTDRIEPASEDFYRGVWTRIKAAGSASPIQIPGKPPMSIGLACWRAVPVLSALVLLVALYGWFYPPDFGGGGAASAESYVLETDAAPSNADLLYQIMHLAQNSGPEAKP